MAGVSVSSHPCSVIPWVPSALARYEELSVTNICSDYSAQKMPSREGAKSLAVTPAVHR